MSDGPRQNDRMLKMTETTYSKSLFSGDAGMWTVFEIVKRPIAKVASEPMANDLIRRLSKAGEQP